MTDKQGLRQKLIGHYVKYFVSRGDGRNYAIGKAWDWAQENMRRMSRSQIQVYLVELKAGKLYKEEAANI